MGQCIHIQLPIAALDTLRTSSDVEIANAANGVWSNMNIGDSQQAAKGRTGLPTATNSAARRGRGAPVNLGNRKNLVS